MVLLIPTVGKDTSVNSQIPLHSSGQARQTPWGHFSCPPFRSPRPPVDPPPVLSPAGIGWSHSPSPAFSAGLNGNQLLAKVCRSSSKSPYWKSEPALRRGGDAGGRKSVAEKDKEAPSKRRGQHKRRRKWRRKGRGSKASAVAEENFVPAEVEQP